jgi:choline dehydrogenase-like flavoprotein
MREAIVIGSGAAGAITAHVLVKAGVSVTMLEAGRSFDPRTESPMFSVPASAPLRGAATPAKPRGYFDATVDGGYATQHTPYESVGPDAFRWWQSRMLGGRTNHWGRVVLRMGPWDFKPKQRWGVGVDWPLTYQDVAPYYDRVEQLIGVSGTNGDTIHENLPGSPQANLQPPPPPRLYELLIARACKQLGITTSASRLAVLTQPKAQRLACLYATHCERSCQVGAAFQTPDALLGPLLREHSQDAFQLITNAQCKRILFDGTRAVGVEYIDTSNAETKRLAGQAVFVCCGTLQTLRLLLQTASQTPWLDTAFQKTGRIGRFVADSFGIKADVHVPLLEDLPPFNDDGIVGMGHTYAPWWLHGQEHALGFAGGGYHMQWTGGRELPSPESLQMLVRVVGATHGRDLHTALVRSFGSIVTLRFTGASVAPASSAVSLSNHATDRWGLRSLRIHYQWTKRELGMERHMRATLGQLAAALAGTVLSAPRYAAGTVFHEVGGARMGDDPEDSVTDHYGRVWGTSGLYVSDGAAFASCSDKNPTLTVMALAFRNAEQYAAARAGGVRP